MAAPHHAEKTDEPRNKRPTALVAGGAGFVGSYLVKALLSQNFHVISIDNLSTGEKDNLKDILTDSNFTFIQGDINDPHLKIPVEIKIDYVFHLASSEDHAESQEFSLDTLLVNSLGTRALLEVARANKAKFILISSADLYSGAISSSSLRYYFGKSPEDESVLSLHEAKRFAEALTFEYFKKFDLPVTIIRLKDVYGPRMSFERGDDLGTLIGAAVKKDKIKIYGDGLKTINPTYITDVVFGTIKAALGHYIGEIFILVNPEKITLENFAQTLKLVAGPMEIEHKKDEDSSELPYTHLDLDNTKEKLGWTPKVTLAEGISSIIQSERLSQIHENVPTDNHLEPLAISVPAVPVVEPVPLPENSKPQNHWVRISIFALSLLLLLTTVAYPISATAVNSWLGRGDLQEASEQLSLNHNTLASLKALAAQNSFEQSAKSLQDVTWLFKIVGLGPKSANFDRLLQASANLSEGIGAASKAQELLITTAGNDSLTTLEASAALNEVLSNLYTSKDKLEQSKLLFDVIDWNKVPSSIAPKKDFLTTQTQGLQSQVDSLIDQIENLI